MDRMTRRIGIVAMSALMALLWLGCSPGPAKEAEDSAKALAEIQMKRWPDGLKQQIENIEYGLDCDKKEIEWFSDRGQKRKEIDEAEAKLEFRRDHLGKCEDVTFDVVETSKQKDEKGNERIKMVRVKFWSYDVKTRGPKDFFLEYEGGGAGWPLVEVDGKWKIHNKKEK